MRFIRGWSGSHPQAPAKCVSSSHSTPMFSPHRQKRVPKKGGFVQRTTKTVTPGKSFANWPQLAAAGNSSNQQSVGFRTAAASCAKSVAAAVQNRKPSSPPCTASGWKEPRLAGLAANGRCRPLSNQSVQQLHSLCGWNFDLTKQKGNGKAPFLTSGGAPRNTEKHSTVLVGWGR